MSEEDHVSADRRGVRETYDRIADHFAATRVNPWPEVESFLADADRVAVGLDVGCGNGRHGAVLAERAERVLGVDASRAVLGTARRRAGDVLELLQGDAGALPVSSGVVGLAVYVATLHHLPTRAARIGSLDELARVLAPDGRAFVSAWSTAHDRFDADPGAGSGFDTTVDWTLSDGTTVPRFYHIYAPGEFRADLAESDLRTVESFVSSGNCYAEVELGKENGH